MIDQEVYAELKPVPENEEQRLREERIKRWEAVTEGRVRYRNCRLSNFEVTCEAQQTAVDAVRGYWENIDEHLRSGTGLVLCGSVGTGKDHILSALLRRMVLNGVYAKWIRGSEITTGHAEWPQAWSYSSRTPRVVAISDPAVGGQELKWQALDRMFEFVDSAYCEKVPLFVTINSASEADMVTMLGPAITDRLLDNSVVIECNWPSYRRPK